MPAARRLLHVPEWLSEAERQELGAEFEAEATPDEDLSCGAWLLVPGDAISIDVRKKTLRRVDLSLLIVTAPGIPDDEDAGEWPSEIAEYLATCQRDTATLSDRAQWLVESAGIFATHVDKLANLPDARGLPELVRWLHLRCAEWRAKVGSLAADISMELDDTRTCGQTLGTDTALSFAVAGKIGETADMQHVMARLQRAALLTDRAASTLQVSHELLQAKLGQYRDEDAQKLKRSNLFIGFAVSFSGVGTIVTQRLAADSAMLSPASKVIAGLVLLPLAIFVLPGLAPERLLDRARPGRHGPKQIEERINLLTAGYVEPLGRRLGDDKLREQLKDHVARETIVRAIADAEREAHKIFSALMRDVEHRCARLRTDRGRIPASGATIAAKRAAAVEWLKMFAYTEGLVTLLYLDTEPWQLPMPDLAVAMWLKGSTLLGAPPLTWTALQSCVASLIVNDLDQSPTVAAERIEQMRLATLELAGLEVDGDVLAVEDPDDDEVQKVLRDLPIENVLEKFSFLRLSTLCREVAPAGE